MKKIRKTSFIIVRVSDEEKAKLKKLAIKARENFSNFIRRTLGLFD